MSMRKIAIVLAAMLIAVAAQAGVIYDIQTGVYATGDLVQVQGATVMVTDYNGAFITELPIGPYAGIWVYLGSGHTLVAGDIVNVQGEYKEYYDLSEIDATVGSYEMLSNGAVPTPYSLTVAEFVADPEPFEGVAVTFTDGFFVAELLGYGEWMAHTVESDLDLMIDNFAFATPVEEEIGNCFNYASGCINYSYSAYKLAPFADGIEYVDCAVPAEATSLSAVKALFN